MEDLFILIWILGILFVLLCIVTVVGHGIWLITAAILSNLFGKSKNSENVFVLCVNCNSQLPEETSICFVCGVSKPSPMVVELLKDLGATARQLERLRRSAVIEQSSYEALREKLERERFRLLGRAEPPNGGWNPATSTTPVSETHVGQSITTTISVSETTTPSAVTPPEPIIGIPPSVVADSEFQRKTPGKQEPAAKSEKVLVAQDAPRKPLTEVIAAFMEESNIQWGEIIGGLLIIGCSTALVVSLWAQISQIPVLKFSIFTTVTASLFGIGLYTEHRWKLPTTSHGILAIATLLVPLNFLAIAAVSGSTLPPDSLVIVSELVGPAVFLCLVYFAGRVLTPAWPHLLTAGVLGSSMGQLLVRHFATPDAQPMVLIALGAFPTICYVASIGWILRRMATEELNESRTTAIFITLGAMTFAAVLPFGLLLFRGGPPGISLMYLAPLITVGGLPALAVGTIIWRRVTAPELLYRRIAGTTLAIIGTFTVLLGMILAWPNPASIVPAALLNFAVFTILALVLEIPSAHFIAALCFALSYLVFFHVIAGHVSWKNIRETSLLDVCISISSAQALSIVFVLFISVSEWLRRVKRELDSRAYFAATLLITVLSLWLISIYGLWIPGDPHHVTFLFLLYSVGSFWLATSRRLTVLSWIGSGLLLVALLQGCVQALRLEFPWQTAFLMHAAICAVVAVMRFRFPAAIRDRFGLRIHYSALFGTLFLVVGLMMVVRVFFVLTGQFFPSQLTEPLARTDQLDWLTVGSVFVLCLARLWDSQAKRSLAELYNAALFVISLFLEQFHLSTHRFVWGGVIALALFALATSGMWHWRQEIMQQTDRLRIPRRIDEKVTHLRWLIVFNIVTVASLTLLAYTINLTFLEGGLRITAAVAVGLQFATFDLLAEGRYQIYLQRLAIVILLIGIALLGWAWLTPDSTGTWLNRAVILMVEMFLITGIYSLALDKGLEKTPGWTKAIRDSVPWLLAVGGVALAFTLCTEIFYQLSFGEVRINPVSLVVIGVTLLGATVVSVLFALSQKHDPLSLSETGRMEYVYAAEMLLALLIMHLRLTMPWLFTGFFDDYWPFVIMAIAYLGVIASEALRRRNLLVLATPIERTGAFLPLLPVLGFWVAQSRVDYSVLLFLVGGVYGGLSILRRSFMFGLLAALAGNGGLWYLLHRTQNYGFLQHPQLWLIPIGLSILLAGYLNREELSEEQMTGLRYSCLLMIYVSSTADIFVNGVADSPWLPLILGGLSLCGIFAGISFRIRGLLLLGSVFLLLAIVTMIYYASVNLGWTWLWYVAGIVTGATIIFMFAVFEKKRTEVLRVVDGFKEWES